MLLFGCGLGFCGLGLCGRGLCGWGFVGVFCFMEKGGCGVGLGVGCAGVCVVVVQVGGWVCSFSFLLSRSVFIPSGLTQHRVSQCPIELVQCPLSEVYWLP